MLRFLNIHAIELATIKPSPTVIIHSPSLSAAGNSLSAFPITYPINGFQPFME